jgi:hypothetical protein
MLLLPVKDKITNKKHKGVTSTLVNITIYLDKLHLHS